MTPSLKLLVRATASVFLLGVSLAGAPHTVAAAMTGTPDNWYTPLRDRPGLSPNKSAGDDVLRGPRGGQRPEANSRFMDTAIEAQYNKPGGLRLRR